ncbi:M48 family metallopeptidase [Rhodoferax lacus]|nr:M48 family metallopeptidase [Rhodoferax lacus]
MDTAPERSLSANYMDGRSAQSHPVQLRLQQGLLHIDGEGIAMRIPLAEVQWPERTRHGKRVAHLAQGGLVQSDDATAWDAWVGASGQRDSLVVKMQQSWRSALASAVLLVGLLAAAYAWGLPLLTEALVAATPSSVDNSLGESTLAAIDSSLMQPSQLSASEQQRIQAAWQQVAGALSTAQVPVWRLVFRKSRIGPNAFALPGGTIVLTDELVRLVDGDTDVLCAVLAHELGHVKHRDGLRMLVQVGVVGSISSIVLGDFSSVLAAVPALLGQAHYSRQAEHQADVFAVQVLKTAHISPATMVTLFAKLEQERAKRGAQDKGSESMLGIAFASHPSDAERVAFFRQAAQ